jgi:hypothetical protein
MNIRAIQCIQQWEFNEIEFLSTLISVQILTQWVSDMSTFGKIKNMSTLVGSTCVALKLG